MLEIVQNEHRNVLKDSFKRYPTKFESEPPVGVRIHDTSDPVFNYNIEVLRSFWEISTSSLIMPLDQIYIYQHRKLVSIPPVEATSGLY
jgi:hypothetical protein